MDNGYIDFQMFVSIPYELMQPDLSTVTPEQAAEIQRAMEKAISDSINKFVGAPCNEEVRSELCALTVDVLKQAASKVPPIEYPDFILEEARYHYRKYGFDRPQTAKELEWVCQAVWREVVRKNGYEDAFTFYGVLMYPSLPKTLTDDSLDTPLILRILRTDPQTPQSE